MITPRRWQAEFLHALSEHAEPDFLLVACPAAGKTIAGTAAAVQAMDRLEVDQLVVVAPTLVVRDQWIETLGTHGFKMLAGCPRDGIPPWVHGAVLTYAELIWRQDVVAAACERRGTVAILDEIHHAGSERIWGETLRHALSEARLRLLLSGTPFRSDADAIPWVRYGPDGTCIADFTYDYRRAVREGVCRPIAFRTHDGTITWSGPDDSEQTATFSDVVDEQTARRRLRASLDPAQPYLEHLLRNAHADLLRQREASPNAAGLVICESQTHACEVDRLLARICGEMPSLAISDQPRAHALIRKFAGDETMWLVSVKMVAEGVDIPRLSVIAFCSGGTELMVKQVAGRALRSRMNEAAGPALVHMPADPSLLHYARHLDQVSGVSTRVRVDLREKHARGISRRSSGRARPPGRARLRAVAALPAGAPELIVPPQPARDETPAPELPELTAAPPELPLSPRQQADEAERLLAQRGEVLHLLNVWTQLRREHEPAFQIASAHAALAEAVGPVGADAGPDVVEAALSWLQGQLREIAVNNPRAVLQIARTQRRLRLATA